MREILRSVNEPQRKQASGRYKLHENLHNLTGYTKVFHGFSQSLQANAGIVPKLGHDRFLPYNLQLINHLLPCHSTLYILELLKSVVK
jgi:hypothetical protein